VGGGKGIAVDAEISQLSVAPVRPSRRCSTLRIRPYLGAARYAKSPPATDETIITAPIPLPDNSAPAILIRLSSLPLFPRRRRRHPQQMDNTPPAARAMQMVVRARM